MLCNSFKSLHILISVKEFNNVFPTKSRSAINCVFNQQLAAQRSVSTAGVSLLTAASVREAGEETTVPAVWISLYPSPSQTFPHTHPLAHSPPQFHHFLFSSLSSDAHTNNRKWQLAISQEPDLTPLHHTRDAFPMETTREHYRMRGDESLMSVSVQKCLSSPPLTESYYSKLTVMIVITPHLLFLMRVRGATTIKPSSVITLKLLTPTYVLKMVWEQ